MANTLLSPTVITREAQRILHQKCNFIISIDRQYDDRFARTGAKIGNSLAIREPNQFTVRTGKTIDVQDVTETSQTLTVATQKGVDINFSTADLTMTIDDFSKRYLDPAMSVLAANMEADAMSMYKDIYNSLWSSGSAITYNDVLSGRVLLQRSLAPGNDRTANMNPQDMADLVKDTKTLFNAQSQIADQYVEGYMGKAAGFKFMENTIWPGHTTGSENGSYVVNTSTGITSGTATITTTGGSGTLAVGDVFTVADVYSVHPETKASTGVLQQFVVTAAVSGTGAWAVSPTPITSGPKQNITLVSAGASKAVVVGGTASDALGTSLLYHKEAFTFVSADLELPGGVDFARRETVDNISMRLIRAYDINNDNMPCRIDVLYGYKTTRPGSAVRLHYN